MSWVMVCFQQAWYDRFRPASASCGRSLAGQVAAATALVGLLADRRCGAKVRKAFDVQLRGRNFCILLLLCIANGDILPRRFWVKLSSVLSRGANLAEQIKLYWSISCDLARVANLPTFLQLKTWTFSGTWLNQHGFMRLHNLQLINPLKLDKLSSCSPAERAQL